jgi:hypothetical protein
MENISQDIFIQILENYKICKQCKIAKTNNNFNGRRLCNSCHGINMKNRYHIMKKKKEINTNTNTIKNYL